MPEKNRIFIAFGLTAEIEAEIAGILAQLSKIDCPVRWSQAGNLHVTLVFLGDINSDQIHAVTAACRTAASGFKKAEVQLGEIGMFPRVIWLGFKAGTQVLADLQHRLVSELSQRGFNLEKREYKPHLTLGRVLPKRKLKSAGFTKLKVAGGFSDLLISEILIMRSEVSSQGAKYEVLEKIQLGGTD